MLPVELFLVFNVNFYIFIFEVFPSLSYRSATARNFSFLDQIMFVLGVWFPIKLVIKPNYVSASLIHHFLALKIADKNFNKFLSP